MTAAINLILRALNVLEYNCAYSYTGTAQHGMCVHLQMFTIGILEVFSQYFSEVTNFQAKNQEPLRKT